MKVEQIYTGCLAAAAYYIESNGEAAIIDPLREVSPYMDKINENGVNLKYVFETHFHADFVSGHIDLAKQSGATIVYGPNAVTGFDAHIASDGEELKIGNVTIKVLHTPGHTMESTTYLLKDESGKDYAIFTGDTLFIGDVGRPDLAVKSDLTQEDLAKHLYQSLREKIMVLDDEVVVYPAHGAGSACGKKMSKETFSTLGVQKATNYALRADMTMDEFVKEVTDGLAEPPQYFPKNAMMNKQGYESIDTVLDRGLVARTVTEFELIANEEHALILDTRKPEIFVEGFIPNSISIGIDGGFAPWVGELITDLKTPILIVADPGREEEVVTRLSRVGYDNSLGYLDGGFDAWKNAGKEIDTIESITPEKFASLYSKELDVLDVRKESEYLSEHVIDAQNFPLNFINKNMAEVKQEKTYYVHCAGGYRSVIACSILKSRGFDNLINVEKGFKGIAEQGNIPKTDYVCPSTLL